MKNLNSSLNSTTSVSMNNIEKQIGLINSHWIVITFRVFALTFSLVNVSVFTRIKSNNSLNRFLLVVSIVDALYSSLVLFLLMFVRFCANDVEKCGPNGYFAFLVFFIFFSEYLTTCLQMFNIILEIFLTAHRIAIISSLKTFRQEVNVKLVSGCIFISCLSIYIPKLFTHSITNVNATGAESNSTPAKVIYKLTKTAFGKSSTGVLITPVLTTTRIVLVSIVLLVLNIVCVIQFKAYLKNKLRIKSLNLNSLDKSSLDSSSLLDQKNYVENMEKAHRERNKRVISSNKRQTKLLIAISFLYILGNLPYSCYYIMKERFSTQSASLYLTHHLCVNMYIILKFVVYFFFITQFRDQMNSFVKRMAKPCVSTNTVETQETHSQ